MSSKHDGTYPGMDKCLIAPVPGDSRMTTFPIGRPDLWKYYTIARDSFWVPQEVNLSNDAADFKRLPAGQQKFIKFVLAFFAASDGFVNLNLAQRFSAEIDILEVGYFWKFQMSMEDIHATMYSLLLEAIIVDPVEREYLLNAARNIPVIKRMTEYMVAATESGASFAERLLRFICVEGIFFIGCFCAIYWLAQRGVMKGLTQSNELIQRDESLHTFFGIAIYLKLLLKLPADRVYAIVDDAVKIASAFISEALSEDLPEMNSRLMIDYIKCQTDNILSLLKYEPFYKTTHQFNFMNQINLENQSNFFEKKPTEYSKAAAADNGEFEVQEDF